MYTFAAELPLAAVSSLHSGPVRPARFAMRLALAMIAIASALALTACSPEYNWRELQLGPVQAAFPGRVQSETRDMPIEGVVTAYSLTTAQVNDTVFAVGVAEPRGAEVRTDRRQHENMARALLRLTYANLHAEAPEIGALPDLPLQIEGQGERRTARALVQVWATPTGVVQAVVIGPAHAFPQEQAREFMAQVVVPGAGAR